MKKITKKTVIKKAQNGLNAEQLKGIKVDEYRAKQKAGRDSLAAFTKRVAGKPKLTPDDLATKARHKDTVRKYSDSIRMAGTGLSKEKLAANDKKYQEELAKRPDTVDEASQLRTTKQCGPSGCSGSQRASERRVRQEAKRKNGGAIKAKSGRTIKKKK